MSTNSFLIVFCLLILTTNNCLASWHDHQQDHYGSYYRHRDVSEIPRLGDPDNFMVNLGGEKARGDYFMEDLVKKTGYKTTVFKIRMDTERIVLADPVAVMSIYDVSKIRKIPYQGPVEFNKLSTDGYIPSFMDNGKSHATKKNRQYKQLAKSLAKNSGYDIFRYMGQQFAKQEPVKTTSTKPVDITDRIDSINQDTQTNLYLGKPINNVTLFNRWVKTTTITRRQFDPTYGSKDEIYKQIHAEMLDYIKSTPAGKSVQGKSKQSILENELMFYALWQSALGVNMAQKSAVKFFEELSTTDKRRIRQEANSFFRFPTWMFFRFRFGRLPLITRFAMEVLRLASSVANVNAIATRDFVVTSLHGRYQIKKGDYLQANILATQSNPNIFEQGPKFSLNRLDQRWVKRNFFDFGGPFNQKPTVKNRKCIGQELAIKLMKMFMLHYVRCQVDITSVVSSPVKTGVVNFKATRFECPNN